MAIFAPAESLPNPATLVGINGRLLFQTQQNRDYLVQVCFFVLIFSTLFFLQTVRLHWALNEFYFYCSKIETLWLRSAIFVYLCFSHVYSCTVFELHWASISIFIGVKSRLWVSGEQIWQPVSKTASPVIAGS